MKTPEQKAKELLKQFGHYQFAISCANTVLYELNLLKFNKERVDYWLDVTNEINRQS